MVGLLPFEKEWNLTNPYGCKIVDVTYKYKKKRKKGLYTIDYLKGGKQNEKPMA